MDVAVLPIAGQPLLFHNRTANANSWIGLLLRGTRSNRDGIGAKVEITACGQTQCDTVRNGGSYLSRDDPRLYF
jgi:enediyne biosynthesis protein E4